jgi:hypothetical protein
MMEIAGLKFPEGFNPLSLVPNVPLDADSVRARLVKVPLAPNQTYSFGDESNLTLKPGGSFAVHVFNSADDVDEDSVLAAHGSGTPEGALAAQLPFTANAAWLKYALNANVSAGTAATLASIGFSVDGTAGASFAHYRRHARARSVVEAIMLDLAAGPRFATVLDHVRNLGTGEAVSVRWLGTMTARVDVAWSDVFAGPALAIGALAGTHGVIGISLKATAHAGFSLEVSDDFMVVFSRIGDDEWRIGVRKATSRGVGVQAGAGVAVTFTDPDAAVGVLNAAIEGVIGLPLEDVDKILERASLDQLSGPQKKAAGFLIKRLGLQEQAATLQDLRARVQAIRDAVPDAIKTIAQTKMSVAFAYEYNRLDERTNLLQATVDRRLLEKHHASLIRGKLDPLTIDLAARVPGATLETYLNQKTLARERSWGFTLGIGKWVDVGGKDFRRVVKTERRNIQGRVQESYLGARGYTGKWVGETTSWNVDLQAGMKSFADGDVPLVSEFDFGLHLVWTADQKKLSAEECEQWLDAAVVWRVLSEADLDHARERLWMLVDRPCDVSLQVAIPDDALRAMFPRLGSAEAKAFASALAIAMPWQQGSGRTSAARRRELYEPLWALYLSEPQRSAGELSRAADRHFDKRRLPELARLERAFHGSRPFTFAGLVELNGDTHAACKAFTRGIAMLQKAIADRAPNKKTIDEAFESMNDLWTQSHHVRAIGAYLLQSAAAAGVLGRVNRTMTAKSGDDVVVLAA